MKIRVLILSFIKIYQIVGPFKYFSLGHCRFTPTCSRYTYQAVERYGAIKGVFIGLKRLLKCHPFHEGGYDPVK